MKNAEVQRSPNRALLNSFFNGEPPWTPQEAKDNGILVNFNDKAGANLLHQARNQYENAFTKTGQFFKVTLPDAPAHKQRDLSSTITRHINRIMGLDRSYYYTRDCVWGGIVLHGVGARVWWDQYSWRPQFSGVQDILIPTDTDLAMENLRFLAFRRAMKPGMLAQKTYLKGKNVDPGWNMKAVKKILNEYRDLNTNPKNWDWSNQPEQMVELYKQNLCYYDGDSAPQIYFWDFYHLEEENKDQSKNGWYRKLMLDSDCVPIKGMTSEEPVQFIYDSRKPIGERLDNFVHFQFGDGNNVPPFKYHSIRSLAWLVYDLVWIGNRLNCQFTQHVFEQLMLLFRVTDPTDRDRLQNLVLQGIVGLLPEGLNMVTAPERYQVNVGLVQGLQANLKQKVSEASSQYTQSVDTGTQKERTKFEVQAVIAQASALMASMLGRAYHQEYFCDVEISRRFCIKNSPDFAVKRFQIACRQDGVEEKYLNSERWQVEVEQVMGGGNRVLELAESTEMMNRVNQFDPEAQAEIKHDFVLALTNNPKKAARISPVDAAPKVSDSKHDAMQSFGTLMLGIAMDPQEGVNHPEQIETLLAMMDERIKFIKQTGGVGTIQDVAGLQAVATYIGKHIQIVAQDPGEKARVKAYTDALSKMMNEVRAFAERQQEAAKKQSQQPNPEVIANIQAMMAETNAKIKALEAKSAQSLQQKEQKHQQDMRLKEQAAMTDTRVKAGTALANTQIKAAEAAAATEMEPKTPSSENGE